MQLIAQLNSKNLVAKMVVAHWFLLTQRQIVHMSQYRKTPGKLGYLMLRVATSNPRIDQTLISRVCASLLLIALLNACAAPLAAIGSSAGSTATATAATYPITTASVATSVATGKSPLEHAASAATKKECNFFNVVDSKPICIDKEFPPITDKSEFYFGPADIAPTENPAKPN